MSGVVAVSLLTAFVVLFRLAYVTFRRPIPPAWTRRNLLSEMVCVGLVALLSVGVTLGIKEIGVIVSEGLGLWEAVAILASVGLAVLVWKLIPAPSVPPAKIVGLQPAPKPNTPNPTSPGSTRKAA
jgi:hypothetical protein